MKSVCVLGNGQLGRMLRQAGEPLGIHVYPLGIDSSKTHVSLDESIITAEIERWPETELTNELAQHGNFINRDVFPLIADRLTQKQLLDKLNLPSAPYQALEENSQWAQLFSTLGKRVIVKRRIGGYDGRGQWQLQPGQQAQLPAEIYGKSIVEQCIPFTGEVSLIGARNAAGECVFYPLTYNLHQAGILRASIVQPNTLPQHLQQQAEKMLTDILQHLNYVGVMAMECFIVNKQLLINELAPRVHNSGHWTQNGASISQFELHLRAIVNLPLPQPIVNSPAIMINLIGTELQPQWLALPLIHLHWYEKEVRPGRKVGHLNLSSPQIAQLQQTLNALIPLLPEEYHSSLAWCINQLNNPN